MIQILFFNNSKHICDDLTTKKYKCTFCDKVFNQIQSKYNEFKNILVTNIKDNYMYKFDKTKGQIVLSTKDEVINTLIDNRMFELETIYDELLEKNILDDKTKDIIEEFINNNDSKYVDSEGHVHDTYKHFKVNEVKLILYNNKDKITSNISLLLKTTSEIII